MDTVCLHVSLLIKLQTSLPTDRPLQSFLALAQTLHTDFKNAMSSVIPSKEAGCLITSPSCFSGLLRTSSICIYSNLSILWKCNPYLLQP